MSNILTNGFLKWVLEPRNLLVSTIGVIWTVSIILVLKHITIEVGVPLTSDLGSLLFIWFASGMLLMTGVRYLVDQLSSIYA